MFPFFFFLFGAIVMERKPEHPRIHYPVSHCVVLRVSVSLYSPLSISSAGAVSLLSLSLPEKWEKDFCQNVMNEGDTISCLRALLFFIYFCGFDKTA
jgi:hypothetical protein